MARLRAWLADGGAVIIVAAVIYLWAAPDFIIDSDSAELTTLGTAGGVPHPPGYPVYMLWLRAMSWLPGSSAHAAALATALLGIATLVILHAACRAWGARPWAATIAVAIVGSAPVVLRYSVEPEAFAFNNLVVATVLWLSARAAPVQGTLRVVALAAVAGLGLADHPTCVLVAPVGILGVVRGVRETPHRMRAIALGVGAFAVGLSPYAYLLVTGERTMSWGQIETAGGLVAHALRLDYGGPTSFSPVGGAIDVVANLGALVITLGRSWLWVPFGGALATMAYLSARVDTGETRWAWRLLALSFVLAGPILIGRFDIAPTGVGLYIAQRFHVMPALLLAIPVAVTVDRVVRRRALDALERPIVAGGVAAAIFVANAALSLVADTWRSPAYDHAMRDLVRSMPADAVIIADGDTLYYGVGYVQTALGERPDVTFVLPSPRPWYRERLARRGLAVADPTALADAVLLRNRPLFVAITMSKILESHPVYPYGLVFRVLPATSDPPSVEQVIAINTKLFDGFTIDYAIPTRAAEHGAFVHDGYAATWRMIAEAAAQAGMSDEAAAATKRATRLAPRD